MLGETERAREWIERGLLLDPDNMLMRYNFACVLADMKDPEGALELLAPVLANPSPSMLSAAKVDPDLSPIRDHPRFAAMVAAAKARLASAGAAGSPSA
ncbi:MAG: tetratricopeptide repeat protein [Caulobacteraceae bacterium]